MIRPRVLLFLIFLIAIMVGLYWIDWHPESTERHDTATDSVTHEALIGEEKSLAREPRDSANPVSKPAADAGGCLTPEQIKTHPMFAEDFGRLDSVAVTGPTIASYRGLSSAELNALATQGDSAAMAVLGAVSLLKARNMTEDSAVPFLLYEDVSLHGYFRKDALEPEAIKHLEEAYGWFYKSALHGRILALGYAGESIGAVEGGPVGLGWIEEDEYEGLRGLRQSAFTPMTVYSALAFEIAPQLRDGPSGIIYEMLPRDEPQATILVELVKQFEKDREVAKLLPIEIAESTAPPMEEVRAMLCESLQDPAQYDVN